MTPTETRIFDRMAVLSDPTRGRVLLLLGEQELAVSELCAVLQQPQSTVSRHLKVLSDDGWLTSWREGTSRLYRLRAELEPEAEALWRVVRARLAALPAAAQDRGRLGAVLRERRVRSREFFAAAAGDWDRLRGELFGEGSELLPLLALLDPQWTVGDLGCGTGATSEALAPFVGRVVAVDESPEMLAAARRRLGGPPRANGGGGRPSGPSDFGTREFGTRELGAGESDADDNSAESLDPGNVTGNVELRQGNLEALPVADGELDAALLVLVLHHLPDPAAVLAEAGRALAPGGRLLVVDMLAHDRSRFRREMGHQWLGFEPSRLEAWIEAAGLDAVRIVPLVPDAAAQGPNLFAARAVRPAADAAVRRLARAEAG